MKFLILVPILLFLSEAVSFSATATLVKVLDGDTIVAKVKNKEMTIKLKGIDCPELAQPGGEEAKQFTINALESGRFNFNSKKLDERSRRLAEVTTSKGKNLNILLVRKGYAWVIPEGATKILKNEEQIAKKNRLGFWGMPPVPPWEYRKKIRAAATSKKIVKTETKTWRYGDSVLDIPRDPDGSAIGSGGSFTNVRTERAPVKDTMSVEKSSGRRGGDSSTQKIDYVSLSGYFDNNRLKIGFLYTNTDTDELVHWRTGSVSVNCKVFENAGSILRPTAGVQISSLNKRVKSGSQDIYITIPQRYIGEGSRAIVECQIDTGWRRLSASEDYSLYDR